MRLSFQPRSLQQRSLLQILLPTFLLLFALSAAGFFLLRAILMEQWADLATTELKQTAHLVDMRLNRPKNLLYLAREGATTDSADSIFHFLSSRLQSLPGVVNVDLLGPMPLPANATWDGRRETFPTMIPAMMGRMHHHNSLVTVSPPFFDSNLKERTITLTSRIDYGSSLGEIRVALGFDLLIEDILQADWWQSNRAYLVDSDGNVLASTASNSDLEHQFPMRSFAALGPLEEATWRAIEENSSGTVFGPGLPPEEVSGFYHLMEAPWTMVVIAPGRQLLTPLLHFRDLYLGGFLILVLATLALLRLTTNRLATRVKGIAQAAEALAQGKFGKPLLEEGRDEVAELAKSFNRMSAHLRQRLAMKEALAIAREIQLNLLPQQGISGKGYAAAGFSRYCDETGGDYFDLIQVTSDPQRACLAVGDVVGHGVGAALLMTTVRAILRGRLAHAGDPATVITDVNRLLCRDTARDGNFVTLFYLELEQQAESRQLTWVRAGHEPALLFDPATGSFSELRGKGLALGIDPDCRYASARKAIGQQGALVLVGSDGLFESRNPQGEQFGRERVKQLLSSQWQRPPEEIITALVAAMDRFCQNQPQHDDITMLVLQVNTNDSR